MNRTWKDEIQDHGFRLIGDNAFIRILGEGILQSIHLSNSEKVSDSSFHKKVYRVGLWSMYADLPEQFFCAPMQFPHYSASWSLMELEMIRKTENQDLDDKFAGTSEWDGILIYLDTIDRHSKLVSVYRQLCLQKLGQFPMTDEFMAVPYLIEGEGIKAMGIIASDFLKEFCDEAQASQNFTVPVGGESVDEIIERMDFEYTNLVPIFEGMRRSSKERNIEALTDNYNRNMKYAEKYDIPMVRRWQIDLEKRLVVEQKWTTQIWPSKPAVPGRWTYSPDGEKFIWDHFDKTSSEY